MQEDSPNHHITDKQVHQQQWEDRHTAYNVDGLARECLSDRKGSSDQGSIGEDKREPGHGEDHSTWTNGRPMGCTCDEKEEDRQPIEKLAPNRPYQKGIDLPPQP